MSEAGETPYALGLVIMQMWFARHWPEGVEEIDVDQFEPTTTTD